MYTGCSHWRHGAYTLYAWAILVCSDSNNNNMFHGGSSMHSWALVACVHEGKAGGEGRCRGWASCPREGWEWRWGLLKSTWNFGFAFESFLAQLMRLGLVHQIFEPKVQRRRSFHGERQKRLQQWWVELLHRFLVASSPSLESNDRGSSSQHMTGDTNNFHFIWEVQIMLKMNRGCGCLFYIKNTHGIEKKKYIYIYIYIYVYIVMRVLDITGVIVWSEVDNSLF